MKPILLARKDLEKLVGPTSFERGEKYFNSRRVSFIDSSDTEVIARVSGRERYTVEIRYDDDERSASCSCPVGDGGDCKHVAAVGLAWIESYAKGESSGKKKAAKKLGFSDIENYLNSLGNKALVDLLMQKIKEDDNLRDQLFMKIARNTMPASCVDTFKRALDEALAAFEDIEWHERRRGSAQLSNVVMEIGELLNDGLANEVVELSEYGIKRFEGGLLHIDDSNGELGGPLHELLEIHLRACEVAKPDPRELAEKLFKGELEAHFDAYYGAVQTYRHLLGDIGISAYEELAKKEWAKIKPLGPNEEDPEKYSKRYKITRIMETLAEERGEYKSLLEIKSRDLSQAYNFLSIAELCKKNGDSKQAIGWAEKGLRAFPKRPDKRIREFLAEEYLSLERQDDAMALIWKEFTDRFHFEEFKLLKSYADRCNNWAEWRDKALAHIRSQLANEVKDKSGARHYSFFTRDHSTLVAIFIWEKDIESAWKEAKAGGCSRDLWMSLANAREKFHPDDAITIYKQEVERVINLKSNSAYGQAIELINKIHKLTKKSEAHKDFVGYLATIRKDHKPKRNLMTLLDSVTPLNPFN